MRIGATPQTDEGSASPGRVCGSVSGAPSAGDESAAARTVTRPRAVEQSSTPPRSGAATRTRRRTRWHPPSRVRGRRRRTAAATVQARGGELVGEVERIRGDLPALLHPRPRGNHPRAGGADRLRAWERAPLAAREARPRSRRRPGHSRGLRRAHGVAQMRDTDTGDDCRIPEDDRCVREVVEQPHPCAEQQ